MCELMFSLSLFLWSSSVLPPSFVLLFPSITTRWRPDHLKIIFFQSYVPCSSIHPSFFLFFLLSFCFSVSQCGVPGWVLWSYRTVCKYDTSCLSVSLPLFPSLFPSALRCENCSHAEPFRSEEDMLYNHCADTNPV